MTSFISGIRPQYLIGLIAFACPICFLAAIPWLKQQPDVTVYLFAGLAAAGTVIASLALAVLKDREMDEWNRSAARFANQWGWLSGGGLVAVLLAVPPIQSGIVFLTGQLANVADPDFKLVLFAFLIGFMTVIFTQMLCTVALSVGWRSWMSGADD